MAQFGDGSNGNEWWWWGGACAAGIWLWYWWCDKLLFANRPLFVFADEDNDWATTAAAIEFKLALFAAWLLPFCSVRLRAAAMLFNARFVPIGSRPFVMGFVWS